jgi:hypothetical protein
VGAVFTTWSSLLGLDPSPQPPSKEHHLERPEDDGCPFEHASTIVVAVLLCRLASSSSFYIQGELWGVAWAEATRKRVEGPALMTVMGRERLDTHQNIAQDKIVQEKRIGGHAYFFFYK